MTKEHENRINPTEVLQIRIDAYFDGRIEEIDEEIQSVEAWTSGVKLGGNIKRKDQELDWLKRIRHELDTARKYVLNSISPTSDTKNDEN